MRRWEYHCFRPDVDMMTEPRAIAEWLNRIDEAGWEFACVVGTRWVFRRLRTDASEPIHSARERELSAREAELANLYSAFDAAKQMIAERASRTDAIEKALAEAQRVTRERAAETEKLHAALAFIQNLAEDRNKEIEILRTRLASSR